MDGHFTNAEILDHIHGKTDRVGRPRGYAGDPKAGREPEWKGRAIKASDLAASIPVSDRKEMRVGDERQWHFTVAVRVPDVGHKLRIVVPWHYRQDERCRKALVTDRITWEVSRIVRVYRRRRTGAEASHRGGKQRLGLGDCQLRDFRGRPRHMHLVMLAYSLLVGELRQGRAEEWALQRLMTIGEACRAMIRGSLRTTPTWAIEQVTGKNRPIGPVVAQLGLT